MGNMDLSLILTVKYLIRSNQGLCSKYHNSNYLRNHIFKKVMELITRSVMRNVLDSESNHKYQRLWDLGY